MKNNSILLIGYSNIARKRLIRVFLKNKIPFSVASKTYLNKINGVYKQFSNYNKALKTSDANIVYISLPNSLHFYWAKKAILNGYHVIVDKPICCKNSETKNLVKLAKKKNKLISESIFYNYHKQITNIKKILKKSTLKKIKAEFVIPLPKKKSLLMSKKFKGGVLMDMGPYASSINRIFFNKKIISSKIKIENNSNKLPISLEVNINYNNQSYEGIFKFGGEYKNQIIFYCKNKEILVNRVFSPPDDQELKLIINNKKSKKIIQISKDNCFENYFLELLNKIKRKDYSFYLKQIEKDHFLRKKIERKFL